jgi:hypothetical protein
VPPKCRANACSFVSPSRTNCAGDYRFRFRRHRFFKPFNSSNDGFFHPVISFQVHAHLFCPRACSMRASRASISTVSMALRLRSSIPATVAASSGVISPTVIAFTSADMAAATSPEPSIGGRLGLHLQDCYPSCPPPLLCSSRPRLVLGHDESVENRIPVGPFLSVAFRPIPHLVGHLMHAKTSLPGHLPMLIVWLPCIRERMFFWIFCFWLTCLREFASLSSIDGLYRCDVVRFGGNLVRGESGSGVGVNLVRGSDGRLWAYRGELPFADVRAFRDRR